MASPVSKLFRWRPVTAWGIAGIMIAVACALQSGLAIDWCNLLIVAVLVLLLQGVIAHGVNDLADEQVDFDAPIESTGRHKILVSGEMSRSALFAVITSAILISFMLVILLAMRAGSFVLFFAAFALFAIFGYSCKPLRLGWRPFAELTVVVPTITMLIVGVECVLISNITMVAILTGVSYGFFNASWFMYSRAQDYDADKRHGKRTTIVAFGLDVTADAAIMYLFVGLIFAVITAEHMHLPAAVLLIAAYLLPAVAYARLIRLAEDRMPAKISDTTSSLLTPEVCADLRVQGMRMTVVYGALTSLAILIGGIL